MIKLKNILSEAYAWERIFGKKIEICEYSGLPTTSSYEEPETKETK